MCGRGSKGLSNGNLTAPDRALGSLWVYKGTVRRQARRTYRLDTMAWPCQNSIPSAT
jgi:hypothetical protein